MSRPIYCVKLKQESEGMATQPFPGELGAKLFNDVSQKAWEMWLNHQTMLINEYRLTLADPQSRSFLREEMNKFFYGDGSEMPKGYVKPK
jgi:Fe-S cluster biosynthesis and repair protein YggX